MMLSRHYKVPDYIDSDKPIHSDSLQIIPASELLFRGLTNDHIASGNDFMENGIRQIMTKTFTIERTIPNERDKTEEDRQIDSIHVQVVIKSITAKPPMTTHYASSKEEILTPKTAMLEDKTYASSIYADIDIIATAQLKNGGTTERKASVDSVLIASIPIMVRSNLCNTHNKSRETLLRMEEDPSDPGGYFIVNGVEWVINNIEQTTYNLPKIFRNIGFKNEVARLEMISKPGDSYENSSQIYIKSLTNNQIVVIIDRIGLKEIEIPFFIMLRLLGWSSDKQMVDWIICDHKSELSKHILERLRLAFKAKYTNFGDTTHLYDKGDILRIFINKMSSTYGYLDLNDEKTVQFVNTRLSDTIDKHLLPHIGSTAKFRHEKALYITYLIRRLLMVELRVMDSTDRDSLSSKRAHSAGVSFAKAFKQQFNFMVVLPIKKQFLRDFKSTRFSQVDLVQSLRSAINSSDFERALSQAITTGTKQQISIKGGGKMPNRLTSQQLHRKNHLEYISAMRQINGPSGSASKQSSRAKEMRRVHPTSTGYTCPIQAQDSENVGLNKQLCISCSIAPGSSSAVLKDIINSDPEFIREVIDPFDITKLARVFVNGHCIGFVKTPHRFADKYRHLRREQKINPFTEIFRDTIINEIHFNVDTGRFVRPMLIVYNNYGNYYTRDEVRKIRGTDPLPNEEDFKQWIALTADDITNLKDKKIDMQYLLDNGIVEYISQREQQDLLYSVDYDTLWENRSNPLLKFTHCDIPTALVGLACLNTPFATHSLASRTILAAIQCKQACGWYSLSWPYRIDREGYLQFHCEVPLVRTLTSDFIQPSGQNCIMAIQIYSGYNQEDSIIFNKAAVQRGLFDGAHFTFEKTELEKGEQFGNPDISLTSDIKQYASYEKIYDGFPKKGTIICKNDVVIGKFIKNNKADGEFKYIDKSKIYKHSEPATVLNVIVSRNQDGKPFAKVHLIIIRPCIVGDKFSMRSGQKGVAGNIIDEEDMPFTKQGIVPDVIFNPQSLPSRMTINTLIETLVAKTCALSGKIIDGTMFRKLDIPKIQDQLAKLGFNPSGKERLYNGMTGKWIDCEIFIGPVYYQRLQKFVEEQIHIASHGSSDAITRQPMGGRSTNGTLRLGEMEKDTLLCNGLSRFLSEKLFDHSDGFKTYICRGCCKPAIVNHSIKKYKCRQCGDNADIAEVDSRWSAKLFTQEMNAMGIGARPLLTPYTYESRDE
jgi:DNA-directed RNA polymerase beta subunit